MYGIIAPGQKTDVHDAETCDAFPLENKTQEGESITMKKTTLLSLATAAAVITTSVGTFAAFDKTSANNTGNGAALDFGTPVTVNMSMDEGVVGERALGKAPSVTTTATVNVQNEDSLGTQIDLDFTLAGDHGTTLTKGEDYTLEVKANSAYLGSDVQSVTPNSQYKDTNVSDGEKKYDVTVTLTDTGEGKIAAENGSANVKLEMTATLK